MRDEITLSEAIEQTKFGYPHFACPDGWLDCDAARVVAESLFDPTPLDLAVLREELGEPGTTDAWELDDQGYAMWLVADVLVMHHWRLGNEFSCRSASVAEKIVVTTLGQLRRILSVIKEQEAAKPCEHPSEYVVREGQTGTLGTVVCPDCGRVREWNAY